MQRKKIPDIVKILSFLALIAVLFFVSLNINARKTLRSMESEAEEKKAAQEAQNEKLRAEWEREKENKKYDAIDYYSMSEFSRENSESVMTALKSGDTDYLLDLFVVINDTGSAGNDGADDADDSGEAYVPITLGELKAGVREILEFAEWQEADFENAVSMGSGSLMTQPDADGRMDVSERFFVDVDGSTYVLFVETVASKWGRENEGVSAIGVMTYSNFDNIEYAWLGEKTDYSALAGKLFWEENI